MALSTPVGTTFGRTNLGPLTTAFSYPASCAINVQACSTCPTVWQAQSCGTNTFNSLGVQDAPDCWPPRANPDITAGVALNGWGFYSPGFSCPIGGYACRYQSGFDHGQTCITTATEGVVIPTIQCSSGTAYATGSFEVPITTIGTSAGGVKSSGVITTVTMFAPMIQLMVQEKDRSPPSSSSSGEPLGTPPPPPSGGAGGLSTGAAAGIGVACGLVGLAVIVGAVLLFLRRRKKKPPTEVALSPQTPLQDPPDKYRTLPAGRGELDVEGAEIYEAPSRPPQWAHTRPAGEIPAELPVSYNR